MIPAFSPTFRRLLPTVTFERLLRFWQSLADREGEWVQYADGELPTSFKPVLPASVSTANFDHRFALLTSPGQQALLEGEQISPHHHAVSITFAPGAIADFIDKHGLRENMTVALDLPLSSPQANLSEQLMLGLLEILNSDSTSFSPEPSLQDSLQASQVKVLSQVIAQIRQSLDLPVILNTAVTAVQKFLFVDRLVIYQFHHGPFRPPNSDVSTDPQTVKLRQQYGEITYEARRSSDISSMLNLVTENDCFSQVLSYEQKFLKGAIIAVNDIESQYSSSYCLMDLLRQYQVRAKLVAPIIVEGKLWGLLIAHQCNYPRQWLDSEKNFLGQIGEHLAVAIVQSKLYSEVQNQKNTFEKRVIERTKELRDTLLTAQAANLLKSQFINNISHELRTPLTSIIGLSGTLLHWFNHPDSLSPERKQQYLLSIQDSGKRLLEQINGIIELSKLESGQTALNCETFSLHTLAQTVIHSILAIAENHAINLQLDYQINVGQDQFCADPERLEQILSQLLNNALKFTPSEGTVILRIWKENSQAIFQVEDTGIGITEQQLPVLFEAFKAVGDNYSNFYETSGIGLALTKQLVELHGGYIEVESSPGQGTIFTVVIPKQSLLTAKKSGLAENLEAVLPFNSSVIVIEQNEEIATLICELLTVANYQVIWLIDTSNALQQVELLQPGLVIIDRDFEDVTEVSRAIKQSHRIHKTTVFLLSESLSSQEWQSLSRQGIDDYLLKPLQPELLLQRIGNIPQDFQRSP
ncbi:MAG: ATP-binding protein [Synechocystis sp.]|nr:ATP-binding protein [Synechocystis sp.]